MHCYVFLSDESLFMQHYNSILIDFVVASGFPVALASNVIDGHGCAW